MRNKRKKSKDNVARYGICNVVIHVWRCGYKYITG